MHRGSLVDAGGALVIGDVPCTSNAWDRLRGLLGRAPPGDDAGLLLRPCASVHTLFMGYAIDVLYLDREYRVLRVVPALAPWRMSYCRGAAMTLELAAGMAARHGLAPGQTLRWRASD